MSVSLQVVLDNILNFTSPKLILTCCLLFSSVMGYTLHVSLIEYKTLVMRGDLERASQILPTIPPEHHNR